MRTFLALAAAAVLSASAADLLAAQATATLAVTVRSSATDAPVPGARVSAIGTVVEGVTDATGRVLLAGLPAGSRVIDVRAPGHLPKRETAELADGGTHALSVEVDLGTVRLEGVAGTAQSTPGGRMLEANGFFDRQRATQGTFVTRADLERMRPRRTSDVVRRYANIKLDYDRFDRARVGSRRSAGPVWVCRATIYVNNMPAPGTELDDVNPDDIEAMEIYTGATESPPEFRAASHCGLILIWTRIG